MPNSIGLKRRCCHVYWNLEATERDCSIGYLMGALCSSPCLSCTCMCCRRGGGDGEVGILRGKTSKDHNQKYPLTAKDVAGKGMLSKYCQGYKSSVTPCLHHRFLLDCFSGSPGFNFKPDVSVRGGFQCLLGFWCFQCFDSLLQSGWVCGGKYCTFMVQDEWRNEG